MNDDHHVVARTPQVPLTDTAKALKAANLTGARKEVLVLGAGMAGLAAAYELQQRGHKVTVLEGSKRVGGRVLTHRFRDGSHVELGAMRVPLSHDYTLHYIKEVRLEKSLIDFFNATPRNFLDIRDVVCRRADGARRIYPLWGIPGANPDPKLYPQYPGNAILGWLLTSVIETMTDVEKRLVMSGGLGTPRLRYLDRLTVGDFLARGASSEVCELINAFTGLDELKDKGLSIFLRDALVGIGGGLKTLRGGMSGLPDGLYKKLAARTVRFEHEVTEIEIDTQTSAKVRCNTPDGPKEFKAPFVICTIPYSVLRLVSLVNFSHAKVQAIRDMSYINSTKVGFACKSRFWESKYGIYGGASVSDRVQRQTYYPMDHARLAPKKHKRPTGLPSTRRFANLHAAPVDEVDVRPISKADPHEPGALLGAYTWGADADRLGALSRDARAEVVMRGISRFHPEIDKQVTEHASIDWARHRWSGGAFAYLLPGQLEAMYLIAKQPEHRVHFAGEHCSAEQAWIQGALISAMRAVLAIAKV
jgi:monoamine oxidase